MSRKKIKNPREIKLRLPEDLFNWLSWYAEKHEDSINHTAIEIIKGRRLHTKEKPDQEKPKEEPKGNEPEPVTAAQDQQENNTKQPEKQITYEELSYTFQEMNNWTEEERLAWLNKPNEYLKED